MIRIELVRQGNKLVGRSASDRWNVATLGLALTYDRNQAAIKRARRAHPGFAFVVVPGPVALTLTYAEYVALTPVSRVVRSARLLVSRLLA